MSFAARTLVSLAALASLGLSAAGCKAPVPVLHENLDQIRYLRVGLQADKDKVYSSNYDPAGSRPTYRPGSEVQITMFSTIRVDLTINKIPCRMMPVGGEFNAADIPAFLNKYFVDSPAVLGLDEKGKAKDDAGKAEVTNPLADDPEAGHEEAPADGGGEAAAEPPKAGWDLSKAESTIKTSVLTGVAAVGMTKEQVYTALGPPPELDFGREALSLPLEQIMESNRWIYYSNWFTPWWFQQVYIFDGEKLIQVEQ